MSDTVEKEPCSVSGVERKEIMRIAQVMDSYYPNVDGPTNVVTYYAKNINEREDATCEVIVPAAKKSLHYVDRQPFPVRRCRSVIASPDGYRMGMPAFDGPFRKVMKEEEYDLLHAHSPFVMARYALKEGKRRHIPVVLTFHTKFREDFDRLFHGFSPACGFMMHYIMKSFNMADSVWTVNEASKKVLQEYGYRGDILVVRNGTDLKYPANADALVERVNALHGLAGQKNVLIFVGRIAMYKNLALMAKALAILKEKEDFRLLVVGGGFDEDKFKEMIAGLGLSDRVIFVGKVMDRELLQGYYLRSDLFLFPSTYDTSSLVPTEAAAHKLPTLLVRGCCTAENITDNVNGFLADETPEAFAARIEEILADPEKRKEVGEEAHRSVYRTWEQVSEEVAEQYKKVIAAYREKHGTDKKETEKEAEKEVASV